MREISVIIEFDDEGLYYGISPELPGLLVATKTLPDMKFAIPRAIIELFAVKDQVVGVQESNKVIMNFKITGEGL